MQPQTFDYDLLAIGDLVVDDFIKLEDAEAHCDIDQENCKLCVRFGDKVPFASHEVVYAVGNSPNAAVSAARLGLKSALVAAVGDDLNGKACLDALRQENVATEFVTTSDHLPTNYHYVLWYDVERTILVNHAKFEYAPIQNISKSIKWIYLSSLGEHAVHLHDDVIAYLDAHPSALLAFQPGTFQMKLGVEKLKHVYARADIFFCNVEEAQLILKIQEKDRKKLMDGLHALGPKIIVMTDGINGAYARDTSGTYFFMPVYPHTPFERTGAGDAYASTVTSCLAMGKTLEDALRWAPINAMSVVQSVGAQKGLLSQEKITDFLSKAPADYQLKEI